MTLSVSLDSLVWLLGGPLVARLGGQLVRWLDGLLMGRCGDSDDGADGMPRRGQGFVRDRGFLNTNFSNEMVCF